MTADIDIAAIRQRLDRLRIATDIGVDHVGLVGLVWHLCDALEHVQGSDLAMLELLAEARRERDSSRSEVDRLRAALIASGRNTGALLVDNVSTDFLMHVPEEVRLVIERLRAQNEELRASLVIAIRTVRVSE